MTYASAVATTLNPWRMPGVNHKVADAIAVLFNDVLAQSVAGSKPGRPLRGRWGAWHSNEVKLKKGASCLSAAFNRVFAVTIEADKKKQAKARKKAAAAIQEDEDDFLAMTKRYKLNSAKVLASASCRVLVFISVAVKEPLHSFQSWWQKRTKEQNLRVKAEKPCSYLQETVLSEFIRFKAQFVLNDFQIMMGESIYGPRWGSLWKFMLDDTRFQDVMSLVINWSLRLFHRCCWIS